MTVKLSDHNMLQKVKISDSFSSQSYNKAQLSTTTENLNNLKRARIISCSQVQR